MEPFAAEEETAVSGAVAVDSSGTVSWPRGHWPETRAETRAREHARGAEARNDSVRVPVPAPFRFGRPWPVPGQVPTGTAAGRGHRRGGEGRGGGDGGHAHRAFRGVSLRSFFFFFTSGGGAAEEKREAAGRQGTVTGP